MITDRSGITTLTLVDLLPEDFPADGAPGSSSGGPAPMPVPIGGRTRDAVTVSPVARWLVLDFGPPEDGRRDPRSDRYRAVPLAACEAVSSAEEAGRGRSVGLSFGTADQAAQWAFDMSDLARLHED